MSTLFLLIGFLLGLYVGRFVIKPGSTADDLIKKGYDKFLGLFGSKKEDKNEPTDNK